MAWYYTLNERYTNQSPKTIIYNIRPVIYEFFKKLLVSKSTIIYIPQWEDEKLVEEYNLRMSSSIEHETLFFPPYDPIIITNDNKNILGILSNKGFAARSDTVGTFLSETLELIFKDPIDYFEKIGSKYGRCLLCKHKISADRSLERCMGPVCYNRLENAENFIKEYILNHDVLELAEARSYNIGIDARPEINNILLDPLEEKGIEAFNNQLHSYYRAGMHIDQTGRLIFSSSNPIYFIDIHRDNKNKKYIRPLSPNEYTLLSAALIRKYHETEYPTFDTELSVFMVPNKIIESTKSPNEELVMAPTTIIPSLKISRAENSDEKEDKKISPKQPELFNAKYEISTDGNEYWIYSFPREAMKLLKNIKGARYDKSKSRMIVPTSSLEQLKTIINLH